MLLIEQYLYGLPGTIPLTCSYHDPHCEGPVAGASPKVGTGEPMTVLAISLYNFLHPRGYRPPARLLNLANRVPRIVRHRFLQPNVTANGQFARFADTYNFVDHGFALGSASQDYVCNTARRSYSCLNLQRISFSFWLLTIGYLGYFPNPQSKLINVSPYPPETFSAPGHYLTNAQKREGYSCSSQCDLWQSRYSSNYS